MPSTDVAQRTPQQELMAQVRGDAFIGQVALVVPEGVSPQRVSRVAITALLDNPDLAKAAAANPDSFFAAVFKCAADGLVPDGRQAALVVHGNKISYMPMVDGLGDMLAEFGYHQTFGVVHERDEFEYDPSPGAQTITHRPPKLGQDRGERIGAWALSVHRDGRRVLTVLDADDVARCKKSARTDKVWKEHTEAMWAKSARKKNAKQTPLGERESERIRALLANLDSDPVAAMYGEDRPALTPAPDESPQAAPAAPPAGGGSGFDYNTVGANQPEPPAPEPERTEAQRMGQTVVPGGPHVNKTIAEVCRTPDGQLWLLAVLQEAPAEDTFRQAVEAYVRGEQPDMWASFEAVKAAA